MNSRETVLLGLALGCEHGNTVVRERTIAGGRLQYRMQCLDCGRVYGPPQKKGFYDRVDEAAAERVKRAEEEFWQRRALRGRDAAFEKDREFWDRYYDHLNSFKWQQLRAKVFNRARLECEGCGERPAVEVHHTTYKHLGNEFLFELLALCRDCHFRVHNGEPIEQNLETDF
jgi:hypothetical protein